MRGLTISNEHDVYPDNLRSSQRYQAQSLAQGKYYKQFRILPCLSPSSGSWKYVAMGKLAEVDTIFFKFKGDK